VFYNPMKRAVLGLTGHHLNESLSEQVCEVLSWLHHVPIWDIWVIIGDESNWSIALET